ncbi:hypothetical protein QTJ16_004210 [Diplocarpon rosae]|uniref:1,3-beta-glucanosyltransferase n=1 Tax=Diplocarpon rosae TaxID=946125 RepID=A0AAD9T2C2_9HELO|nr:hypothetical protein QTJ16_004210 [Diplocarpon rosae]
MLRRLFVIALLACLALGASALSTISVKGSKFFVGGDQFFLRGVAYQGTPNDPLVDTNQCRLDAQAMQSIGTNSIRVYHVDPVADHDGCMSAFRDAGIYIWLDVDTFTSYIVQTDPAWTKEQFAAYAQVVDAFQQFDNLGGFWIGNEVINNLGGSPSAPYIKAAVADMKSYIHAKSYRQVPIGYSAADIAELRPMLQEYLACGEPDEAIDFFGLNSYEWCGDATYQTSGYSALQEMALGYSLPIFFSETGCNVGGERTFKDQEAIFGPEMIDTWSGSIVYEWVEETNAFGIVTYPNGQIYSGAPIPIQPEFENLSNVWKGTSPTGVSEGSYTPKYSAPACPAATGGWTVDGDVPLPRLDSSIIKAIAAEDAAPANLSSTKKPSTTLSPSAVKSSPPFNPTLQSHRGTGTLTTSTASPAQAGSSWDSGHSIRHGSNPRRQANTTSSALSSTSYSTTGTIVLDIILTIEDYDKTQTTTLPLVLYPEVPNTLTQIDQASSITAKNQKATVSASSPASTSKSAANAVTPPPFIAYVDNLGGHGGEVGFLVLSSIFVLGVGAFL